MNAVEDAFRAGLRAGNTVVGCQRWTDFENAEWFKFAAAAPKVASDTDAAASEAGEVAIWSGEHRAYWRRGSRGEGAGYTLNVEEAGVWSRADAVRLTSHCGSEKLIALHERPTTQGGAER